MAGHIFGKHILPVDYKGCGISNLILIGVFITITIRPPFLQQAAHHASNIIINNL